MDVERNLYSNISSWTRNPNVIKAHHNMYNGVIKVYNSVKKFYDIFPKQNHEDYDVVNLIKSFKAKLEFDLSTENWHMCSILYYSNASRVCLVTFVFIRSINIVSFILYVQLFDSSLLGSHESL